MVLRQIRVFMTLVLGCVLATAAYAEAPIWIIQPADSKLSFTATQNGAPVGGEFKTFTGTINFDPAELTSSRVNINVDLASVATSYKEVADTLKTPDWFDTKQFPKATFTASQFKKTGDKSYEAAGTLTIRDKTLPLTVKFNLEEYTATDATVTGSAVLKRSAYGVGQGEWKSTDSIKDEVKVNFVLKAVKS